MRIQLVLKRITDVCISLTGLFIVTIPFVVIAIAIKLDSKGPVFFRQERVGKNAKPFLIWKFRTMVHDPARVGPQPPPRQGDKLVTRVGHILRRSALDELPQLINVLLGDMSLVGPRPVHPFRADTFNERQKRRLFVKPGVTGWALIHGRNKLSWDEKLKHDLWYVDHISFLLDLRIIWRTPWILLHGEGVYMDRCDSLMKQNHYSPKN